jgi:hypothetical protein
LENTKLLLLNKTTELKDLKINLSWYDEGNILDKFQGDEATVKTTEENE